MQKKQNDSKPEDFDLFMEANMAVDEIHGVLEEEDFDEDASFDEEMLEEMLAEEDLFMEDGGFDEEAVFDSSSDELDEEDRMVRAVLFDEPMEEMPREASYTYNDGDNGLPRSFFGPEDSACGSETCVVCRPRQ